jgi:RimJ/RimL family protein N-acetyltransferase
VLREVRRYVRVFKSRIRNQSVPEIAALLLQFIFKKDRILIYVKELDSAIRVPSGAQSNGHKWIVKGDSSDLEMLRKNMTEVPWEFMCDLYDGVEDFFIYKDDGVIGHISWVYYRGDPNRIIDLAVDEGEIKYALTLPQFRGRGIYPAALIRIQRFLQENGCKRIFICVKEDNRPSIRGIEKAGFKFLTKIDLLKVLGIQLSKRYATNN